jgi:hypothetical protein
MTDRTTLGEVSHTNPYTDEAFGETQTYGRGRTVAADGGSRSGQAGAAEGGAAESAADETEPDAEERDTTLKGVDHTRDGAPSANAAYDRDDDGSAERSPADGDDANADSEDAGAEAE